jgi:hypothetical protein
MTSTYSLTKERPVQNACIISSRKRRAPDSPHASTMKTSLLLPHRQRLLITTPTPRDGLCNSRRTWPGHAPYYRHHEASFPIAISARLAGPSTHRHTCSKCMYSGAERYPSSFGMTLHRSTGETAPGRSLDDIADRRRGSGTSVAQAHTAGNMADYSVHAPQKQSSSPGLPCSCVIPCDPLLSALSTELYLFPAAWIRAPCRLETRSTRYTVPGPP